MTTKNFEKKIKNIFLFTLLINNTDVSAVDAAQTPTQQPASAPVQPAQAPQGQQPAASQTGTQPPHSSVVEKTGPTIPTDGKDNKSEKQEGKKDEKTPAPAPEQSFFEKNKLYIMIGGGVLLAVIIGFFVFSGGSSEEDKE